MIDRRTADSRWMVLPALSTVWRRFRRHQRRFSLVTTLLAVTLALIFLLDLLVSPHDLGVGFTAFWGITYLVFIVLPLALGRRFPWWLGLLFIVYLTLLAALSALLLDHPHQVLNTLLEVPVVAVYLGWFFVPWLARTSLAVNLVVLGSAIVIGSSGRVGGFSETLALVYAVFIAGFCLEAGLYLRRRAEYMVRVDPLTGVLNRRGFAALARDVIARARRRGEPLSVVGIDLDRFKAINDTLGHAVGDAALRESAQLWVRGLDARDLIARVGGDEFALLVHWDAETAGARLADLAARSSYPWSWGVVDLRVGETLEQAQRRADVELYRAKAARRD